MKKKLFEVTLTRVVTEQCVVNIRATDWEDAESIAMEGYMDGFYDDMFESQCDERAPGFGEVEIDVEEAWDEDEE